jgi:hypothetical protein
MGAGIVGIIWYLKGVSQRMQDGSKASGPEDPNLSEIVRLMRHMQSQELVVQMDGKSFIKPEELSPAQQRRLVFTSNVLAKWLADVALEFETADEAAAEVQMPALEGSAPAETMPEEPPTKSFPPSTDESSEEVKPVSTDLPDMVGGVLNPAPPPKPAFNSIALQINEILQDKLLGTELESRGITLQDGPDRGVMVTLDGKRYNGVMEVPDEQVRSVIREAVVEWETRK